MNLTAVVIAAGIAVLANGFFWFRKGMKTGDRQADRVVKSGMESKMPVRIALNEIGGFSEYLFEQGKSPDYPVAVLDIDYYDWDGRVSD